MFKFYLWYQKCFLCLFFFVKWGRKKERQVISIILVQMDFTILICKMAIYTEYKLFKSKTYSFRIANSSELDKIKTKLNKDTRNSIYSLWKNFCVVFEPSMYEFNLVSNHPFIQGCKARKVISEVYTSLVLQYTLSGR